MKKIVYFVLMLQTSLLLAQTESGFNFGNEINNLISFPKSPEADAFEQYGNTQVDLYSGKPSIEIPLHVIEGREFSVPISLSYDASGIRVDQIATQVGLGWNLVCGGRISLMANGVPDHSNLSMALNTPANSTIRSKINQYTVNRTTFNTTNAASDYLAFVKDASRGVIDPQFDYYSLNSIGINDYIVFDSETYMPRTLLNPRITVEAQFSGNKLSSWVVTNEDGTKYYFGQDNKVENTVTTGQDTQNSTVFSIHKDYISSWLLTKIESKNKKDIFEFNYQNFEWHKEFGLTPVTSKTYRIDPFNAGSFMFDPTYSFNVEALYKMSQQVLIGVTYNAQNAATFLLKTREDIIFETNSSPNYTIGNALDKIVFNFGCSPKEIKFNTSYFGSFSTGESLISSYHKKRLKLDSLLISDDSQTGPGQQFKKYEFEYFDPQSVPSLFSLSRDYMGLNNCASNSDLISSYQQGSLSISGANRTPSFSCAVKGTLKKIYYPTGGYSEFEFEGHSAINIPPLITTNNKVYANLGVSAGSGDYNLSSSCMRDIISGDPKVDYVVFTLTPDDFAITTTENGIISFSDFHLITNGYAFITKLNQTCENYEGPFLVGNNGEFLLDENNEYIPCGRNDNPLYCLYNCLGDAYIPVPTYDFCFNPANQHTATTLAYYNTGGNMTSLFNSGVNLNSGPSTQLKLNGPGTYQLTLFNPNVVSTDLPTVSATIYRSETKSQSQTHSVSGFRISSIKDFTDLGVLSNQKDYDYNESGICLTVDSFITASTKVKKEFLSAQFGLCDEYLVTYISLNSMGGSSQQSHVVYGTVIERSKDSNNLSNGQIVHKFNVGQSGIIGVTSNGSIFENHFEMGKVFEKTIFSKENQLLVKETTEYQNFSSPNNSNVPNYFSTNTGFSIEPINDIESFYAVIYLAEGSYRILLLPPFYTCYGFGCCPQPYPPTSSMVQAQIGTSNFTIINSAVGIYDFNVFHLGASGRFGAVIKTETEEFLNGNSIKTYQEFAYDKEKDYMLRSTLTKDSYDQINRQDYYYPIDLNSSMYSDHRKSDVITTETFSGSLLTSKRTNHYTTFSNGWYVNSIQTAKGEQTLDTRMLIDYYPNGNIKEIRDSNVANQATKECYIWGYNQRYPVAKIVGVGHSSLDPNLITTIQNETQFNCETPLTTNLGNAFTALRNALPGAMITTFTYNPQGKVTNITAPNGQTNYFKYDELMRLQQVIDHQGNIVSENNYHYRTQN